MSDSDSSSDSELSSDLGSGSDTESSEGSKGRESNQLNRHESINETLSATQSLNSGYFDLLEALETRNSIEDMASYYMDHKFEKNLTLLSVEEYQVAVTKCVFVGLSWEETRARFFRMELDNRVAEKTVALMYLNTLADHLIHKVSEIVTILCCKRDRRFFEYIKHVEKPDIHSIVWRAIVVLGQGYDRQLTKKQLHNFVYLKPILEDNALSKSIEKKHKLVASRCRHVLNELIPHFFDDSIERELLSCLFNWFTCGDMSLPQLNQWKELAAKNRLTSVKALKKKLWIEDQSTKEHVVLFKALLDDLPVDELTRKSELLEFLEPFLAEPIIELVDRGSGITVKGKGLFLSDILPKIRELRKDSASVQSISVYAKFFLGIDADLENKHWRGMNVSFVSEKITVWQKSVLDLSGRNFSTAVRGTAGAGGYCGRDGEKGEDGRAGESSGNIAILTNKLMHPKRLTVRLKGGSGEGGQHGGRGADGHEGISISQSEFVDSILKYSSLYRDSWSSFVNWAPGIGWNEKDNDIVYQDYKKWLYRTYKNVDGREMIYSFAGDCGRVYNSYDILFMIKGTDGTMGGCGGSNGVGGEGGNGGEFIAKNLKTMADVTSINVDISKGKDGEDGTVGRPGNPGVNGNHMAMIDRSSGGMSWSARAARHFFGGQGRDRLEPKYEYSESSTNALNGLRKHKDGVKDCYMTFASMTVPGISSTKQTEKRTSSDRTSQTVSKDTISLATLLEEFAEVCEGDEVNFDAGDVADFSEFHEEEDELEQEEQVQEEISIIRTLIEDSQEHEKKLRRSIIKPDDVLKEINSAVDNRSNISLPQLIVLWKRIFQVPLCTDDLGKPLEALLLRLKSKDFLDCSFKERRVLSNGMTFPDVQKFIAYVENELKAKKELSCYNASINLSAKSSMALNLKDNELWDVIPAPLEHFWLEVNEDKFKRNLLIPFFNQLSDNPLKSKALLTELRNINIYLKKHATLFAPFAKNPPNWADILSVQNYLNTFLTEKEMEKLKKDCEEAEKKAQKKREEAEKEAQVKMEKAAKKARKTAGQATEVIPTTSSDDLQLAVADDVFEKKNEASLLDRAWNYFSSDTSKAFKPVDALVKDSKTMESVFGGLKNLLKNDRRLAEKFCIAKNRLQQLQPPGSTAQSLVHVYFFSEQILTFAVRLFRYYEPFSKGIVVPNDWYYAGSEVSIKDLDDLMLWLEKNEFPKGIDSEMMEFMQRNGTNCRAYRQLIADEKKVNVQVFCESGYCKMRLVENLNPEHSVVYRLVIKNGGLLTVAVNDSLRKLRAITESCKLNIALPSTSNSLDLTPYFPEAFESKVKQWTETVIVTTNSSILPRFLQRLFELRGNSMSIVEFQFAINTIIEAHRDFGVTMETLCNKILAKNGEIADIFLALRITGAMKGAAPKLVPLVTQLSVIKEPRLKALFGSKLHEIPMTEDILASLVNMLAHAEDRVAQLERMQIREWVDIAKCQRWNAYGPLLESYGTVGYFLVFLNTFGSDVGLRLQRIIDKLKEKKCYLLEKLISVMAFLVTYNEITFDDAYEADLSKLFGLIQEDTENILKTAEVQLKERDLSMAEVKHGDISHVSGNIILITNEVLQHVLTSIIRQKFPSEWNAVFPEKSRSLDDLLRLSVNPQDDQEKTKNRRLEMKKLGQLMTSNGSGDIYITTLHQIDKKLTEVYGKSLRETQKIAILAAARSENNLLSQVNTGEGKSFIISCLAILRILINKKDTVDIITSSSVLAQRDAENMKKLYEQFDIKAAHNCDEELEKRRVAYKCNVVYGDISRFERDYLLQTFYKKNIFGSRKRCNVIIDEVDSMLLDNGSNMLYLSHNVPGLELLDSFFVYLHKLVHAPPLIENGSDKDFTSANLRKRVLADMCGLVTKEDIRALLLDKKKTAAHGTVWRILLTNKVIDSEGILSEDYDSKKLGKELLSDCGKTLAGRVFAVLEIVRNRRQEICIPKYLKPFVLQHLDEFIKNAKQGLFLKHNDEYVVDLDHTGRSTDLHPVITIIDKGTGTDLNTSQWSEGLHQFLQLKHGCRLSPVSLKAVFISNVTYLKGYERLNGFSGTLGSKEESNSLVALYDADLMRIPTWKAKIFNENAPVLATTKPDWIQNIFDEICDQVTADRSVLVICQSITEVDDLSTEFQKLYRAVKKPLRRIQETFNNVTVYKREFDGVNFSEQNPLPSCRLIISTNLAGRGTDIVLSEQLAACGGLHVIVSFLPENSRIENQAYGRAARCGEPGSGQIICFVHEEDNGANNIFQLKQFRDNAEVHRLRSLKQFYDYHIEIEEICLKLFQDHCSEAMEVVHSTTEKAETTPTQIIYFALLNEWAKWLDSKCNEIQRCEKNKNDALKAHIIASVQTFLCKHPLPEDGNYKRCLSWIDCPQPLLSIALIHMQAEENDEAMLVLKEISQQFPEFGAESSYYQGVIEQKKIREAFQVKGTVKKDKEGKIVEEKSADGKMVPVYETGMRLDVTNWIFRNVIFDDDCPDKFVQIGVAAALRATGYFLQARGLFLTRIKRKYELNHIVRHLQQNSVSVSSRGFITQQEEAIAVLECFIGSIDDILGHCAKIEDVRLGDEMPQMTVRRFREMFRRADIVTPPVLANWISSDQISILSYNHYLPSAVLLDVFERIRKNDQLEEYDGQKVIQTGHLTSMISIPSTHGFWESLRRAGCFFNEQVYIAVKKSDRTKVTVLKDLESTSAVLNNMQLQLSTQDLSQLDLFDVHGSAAAIKKDHRMNVELQEAQEAGLVSVEVIATLNPIAMSVCHHLDQFSYLTVETVAMELSISDVEALWILETLSEHGAVGKRTAEIEKPPTQEEILEMAKKKKAEEDKKTKETLTSGLIACNGSQNGSQNANQNEESLISNGTDRTDSRLDDCDVTPEAGDAHEKGDNELEVSKETITKQLCTIYVPTSRISCDMFPSAIRQSIHMMLTRNFAYSYALNSLRASIFEAIRGNKSQHRIYLPADPYLDLFNDMQSIGVIQHPRVTTALNTIYAPSNDMWLVRYPKQFFGKEVTKNYIPAAIYTRLEPKIPKLTTGKCTLVETSEYLQAKNVPASQEIRKAVSNGLKKVAVIQKTNFWKWLLGVFARIVQKIPIFFRYVTIIAVACISILFLAVAATVGTTLYFLSLMGENQKIAAGRNLESTEEFRIMRSYHEETLKGARKLTKNDLERDAMRKVSSSLIMRLVNQLANGMAVTDSAEDVSLWKETLENCCRNSTHLGFLKKSIEQWFQANARNIYLAHFNTICISDAVTATPNPSILPAPTSLFAFSSLLISDVNASKRRRGARRDKAISTKLDFTSYPTKLLDETKDNGYPLSSALYDTLKIVLEPMIDEAVSSIIDPAVGTVDVAWRKSREPKTAGNQLDEKTMKNRSVQNSAERLAKEQTIDFLSTDLHNIFLRICFREPSHEILRHMIKYNYPMSAHCATVLFDTTVTILQKIDKALEQVDIQLKRDEHTIFTYSALKDGCTYKKDKSILIVGLERDTFCVLEDKHQLNSHKKYPLGLVQALTEYSNKFCEHFSLDAKLFTDLLMEDLSGGLDRRWIRNVSWSTNEKLICSVAN